jgi:hypothetical protein
MPEIKHNVATQLVRRRFPDERHALVHHFNVGRYPGPRDLRSVPGYSAEARYIVTV